MKKQILFSLVLFAGLSLMSYAQTTYKIAVSNFKFTPNSLTGVKIGDHIEFDWSSGDHTATSVSVPATATTFDFPMTSSNTVGTYTVQVAGTYNYQCSIHGAGMAGSFVVDAATSISTVKINEMSIEPNPAHDFVNLKFGDLQAGTVKLVIYDMLGKMILSKDIEHTSTDEIHSLDVSNLSSGIYLVYINTGTSTSKAHRLVKR